MTATLEQPVKYRAPERYQTHDEEDFEVFPDVAVFKEHVNDEGFVYDKPRLEAIIEKCNKRISDTGDYAAVTLGHTPDSEDGDQPPLIGFAGPFRLGVVGEDEPKLGILADFRIFHEDVKAYRKHPRRSVEIWKDETPDGDVDIHFDPIACLSGVAPKLDLGLVYSKDRHSQKPERYEMSTAGGTNTFIPTTDGSEKKKPERNNKEPSMLSPEDLGQIAEAMKPMIAEAVNEIIPAAPAMEPAPGGMPPVDTAMPDYDPDQMGHMGAKFAKYAKEGEDDDNDGALRYMETFDDGENDHFRKYMGDHDDGRQKDMYNLLEGYMKSDNYEAGAGYKCPDKEDSEQYSAKKYRKENTDLRVKYRKEVADRKSLQTKYFKLESETVDLRKAEKYAKRKAVFTDLITEGYCVDVENEIETTESFTDEQFSRHVEKTIPEQYSRVPGGTVPIPGDVPLPGKTADAKKAEKYSAKAKKITLDARNKDPKSPLVYSEVLDNVTENEGDYVAA